MTLPLFISNASVKLAELAPLPWNWIGPGLLRQEITITMLRQCLCTASFTISQMSMQLVSCHPQRQGDEDQAENLYMISLLTPPGLCIWHMCCFICTAAVCTPNKAEANAPEAIISCPLLPLCCKSLERRACQIYHCLADDRLVSVIHRL